MHGDKCITCISTSILSMPDICLVYFFAKLPDSVINLLQRSYAKWEKKYIINGPLLNVFIWQLSFQAIYSPWVIKDQFVILTGNLCAFYNLRCQKTPTCCGSCERETSTRRRPTRWSPHPWPGGSSTRWIRSWAPGSRRPSSSTTSLAGGTSMTGVSYMYTLSPLCSHQQKLQYTAAAAVLWFLLLIRSSEHKGLPLSWITFVSLFLFFFFEGGGGGYGTSIPG